MNKLYTAIATSLLLLCSSALVSADTHNAQLQAVIDSRSEEDRSRDAARHPGETLAFFQVKPGMTVAEGLPGRGWYTTILANYLGSEGTLYGVNYAERMWPMFGWDDELVASRVALTAQFPQMVASLTDNGIKAQGFTFESVPEDVVGTVDRVLLIRALHNLNRFEKDGATASKALQSVHEMLKPDGLVGVVQHRAPESASDASASGHRGYLKQSAVIALFEKAGFELVQSSEINANPKDMPGEDAIVWRLTPTLRGTQETATERAAIGESDRMTLLFRKQ